MTQIGIFFGTESGTTRLMAKKIATKLKKRLGEHAVAKPVNVNRIEPDVLTAYSALILGTPTYGDGLLPGLEADNEGESWAEFLVKLEGRDFTGVRIALYGLGDQETYPKHFVDGMMHLYRFFSDAGAELVGGCSTEGYEFAKSKAVVDGRFVGLALDHGYQPVLTDPRIDAWLDEVLPLLTGDAAEQAAVAG